MKTLGARVLLGFMVCAGFVLGDNLLPLNSIRNQIGGTCWAYGASHMAEARFQFRARSNVAFDIQKSFYFWQIKDRLLNSFRRKKKSEDLLSEGGFAGNYFYILALRGFETFKIMAKPSPLDQEYPKTSQALLETPVYNNNLEDKKTVQPLEDELIKSSMTESEVIKKIDSVVTKAFKFSDPLLLETPWLVGSIKTAETYKSWIESDDTGGYSPYSFVLLSSFFIKDHAELDGKWVKFDDDRLFSVGKKDVKETLKIVRASLDRNWPATLETEDHVMAVTGYKTLKVDGATKYVYGLIDSSGAYFDRGFSWVEEADLLKVMVDATVFYSIVKDLLPAIPNTRAQLESVFIPRRH